MSLLSPVYTYLHAGTCLFMYFFLQALHILSINVINALSFNYYVCYQIILKVILVSV